MDQKEVTKIVKKLDRMRRKELHNSIDYMGNGWEEVRRIANLNFDIVGDAIRLLEHTE